LKVTFHGGQLNISVACGVVTTMRLV